MLPLEWNGHRNRNVSLTGESFNMMSLLCQIVLWPRYWIPFEFQPQTWTRTHLASFFVLGKCLNINRTWITFLFWFKILGSIWWEVKAPCEQFTAHATGKIINLANNSNGLQDTDNITLIHKNTIFYWRCILENWRIWNFILFLI